MIRVLLADDQALVRAGLRALLDAQDDIQVVGEAEDGEAALRMAAELIPDVVLMDIRMPRMDGLKATRRIVEDRQLDQTRIVILTTFDVDEYVFEALRVGASGFLVKDTEPELLLQGVRAVARGDALLSPGVTRRLIGAFAAGQPTAFPSGSDPDRILATVMFSDIVASTERAAQIGDRRWREVLDRHDELVREQLAGHGGQEINTTGDGFLALFDAPARAIRCAVAIRDRLGAFGIDVRIGLHSGEVELRGNDVGGIAVHIGARVTASAAAGDILVSSTVRDLVAGSGIGFLDRDEHVLKGVPGRWRLFAVAGNEWCSCETTQRPPCLRSPMVSRRRLPGSFLSSSSVPQRSSACAKATSAPAVTSSETISNAAPCCCHSKKGGHVWR
jgi:DNA-binding NarL/FixJ family response regulator